MKRVKSLINNCLRWYFCLIVFSILSVLLFAEFSFASESSVIAVLRFENKSAFDRLDPFEVALPYMLISDLSKISGIQLVERDKIDKLMAETGLAEKDLMDLATMQKTGKALGANFIITGSFKEKIKSGMAVEDMSESDLTINVKVKKIATGKTFKEIQVVGKSKEFFKLEKEIIKELTEVLNMSLPEDIRKQVDRISTQSLEAVLHFGKGEQLRIMSGYYGVQDSRRGTYYGKISEGEAEKLLLQAVSEFRQALYLDSKYADTQYAIAVTFGDISEIAPKWWAKYCPKSISESEKFILLFPDDARCVERAARLGSECSLYGHSNHTHGKEKIEYFDKAIQWYKKRVFEYVHIQKGIVEAIRQLAYVFERKKDYLNAVETFEYLIKHYPEEKGQNLYPVKMQARYRIFRCYRKMKKHDKALETLNYIITNKLFTKPYLDKSYPKKMQGTYRDDILVLRKLRGDIYFEMGSYQEAINELMEISKEVSELSDNGIRYIMSFDGFTVFRFWFDMAEAHRKLNKKGQVIYSLEKAIGSHPPIWDGTRWRDAYRELGQFYEEQGDYAKALSIYEISMERMGPSHHLEKRIPICLEKLGIAQKDKLVEWASLSPLREKDNRFVIKPSAKGATFMPTSIAIWKRSVWIPFVIGSSYKKDSEGNFNFKVIKDKLPGWYLYCLNLNSMTEKFLEVPDEFRIGSGPRDFGKVTDIAVDDKEIWLSCDKRGIVCYDRLLEKWTHFTTDNGLVFNTAHCLALSQEIIWCGLGEKGRGMVMAYDRRQKKWFFYQHPVATATAVTSMALDGDNLWVGNDEGTISILNTQDSSWEICSKNKYSIIKDICVTEDAVWFACNHKGIRRYDKKTSKWETWHWSDPDAGSSFVLECVNADGSNVWAGGNGGHTYKLDTLSNQFIKIDSGRFFKLSRTSSIAVCDNLAWFVRPDYFHNIIMYFKGGIRESLLKVNKKE